MTRYTEGFSHFVTSMTVPVASGWSDRRVGLAPTDKRRLTTAHKAERWTDRQAWRLNTTPEVILEAVRERAWLPE